MENLIRAGKKGDVKALEALFARHEVDIRLYAAKLVPRRHLADDVAQEAFCAAWENIDRYDTNREFGLWVRGFVRNIARRQWSRLAKTKKMTRELAEHVETLAREADEDADHEERLAALRRCLERLPSKSARLLHMVFDLGFTYAEIATHIGTTISALKSAMSRLRRRLKKCVEKELEEGLGLNES